MVSENFKSIAKAISRAQDAGIIHTTMDTYAIITLADFIEQSLPKPPEPVIDPNTHEGRVRMAIDNTVIRTFMQDSKKIHAIKELRIISCCTLKEAKDAIEDDRVSNAFGTPLYRPNW